MGPLGYGLEAQPCFPAWGALPTLEYRPASVSQLLPFSSLPTGLHQRPAEVPAVLPGLCSLHPAYPESPHHWLSLQETGPAAQVNLITVA